MSFLLIGCQSQVIDVKGTHKTTIDKWSGLANYASSRLNHYPIYIIANFTLEEKEGEYYIVVDDFQISNKISQTQIDLLTPTFINKLICSPQCYYFNEYIIVNKKIKKSIVSHFFNEHEFKLFNFYSKLFLLNDKIVLLEELNKKYVALYFQSIVEQKNKYDSLNELAIYLQKELTPDKYQAFLNNTRNIVAMKVRADNADMPEDRFTDMPDIPKGKLTGMSQETLVWAKYTPPTLDSVKSGSLDDFELGDTVCTRHNSLGTIIQIMGNQVVIDEIARVQVRTDGILFNAAEGFIRFKDKNFDFKMIDNNKVTSPIADIFSCEIQ